MKTEDDLNGRLMYCIFKLLWMNEEEGDDVDDGSLSSRPQKKQEDSTFPSGVETGRTYFLWVKLK